MLSITSIKKGIVIDHIKAGIGYRIYKLLNLQHADYSVALITNARSKKLGRKDMIKIENVIDLDLNPLCLLDENLTINVIEDEEIVKKVQLTPPDQFEGIFECKNPRCITTIEREIVQKFDLINDKEKAYKCHYCDHLLKVEK